MAKSIRSKRKKKFKAIKRLRLKPKFDKKLKEILMTNPTGDGARLDVGLNLESTELKQSTDIIDPPKELSDAIDISSGNPQAEKVDVDMKEHQEPSSAAKSSKKNAKVPLHLLSQRKLRKVQNKRKTKQNKIFKW